MYYRKLKTTLEFWNLKTDNFLNIKLNVENENLKETEKTNNNSLIHKVRNYDFNEIKKRKLDLKI